MSARVAEFQADLKNLDTAKVIEKYFYSPDCAKLTASQYEKLRKRIAGKFKINEDRVILVGSARLGFSIAPTKRYKEFNDSSDIDVAIVSTELYEQIWKELFEFERSGAYWERSKECEHYCFRGWIRPDKLPHSSSYPFSKAWWDFFRTLTASSEFGPYQISGAIYHSEFFFKAYQRICIDQCKQEIE